MFNNRHMENQRRKTLVVPAVDPRTHEGTYTCTAQDSFTQTSSSFFLPIKYAPVIDRLPVQTAAVGGDAKVACWFNGYPDSPAERWMKDGQSIPVDRTRFNPARDARYHTGITSYRLKIYNVQQTDYGHYSLNVSNSYGSTTCHAMLKDPAEIIDLKPAPKQADPEKCCAESGVSQLCQ
ncbi:myotilin, partial [Aplysia californica]|uniref:Myotilin n=1 Tax=Aplysia californica TaxID=6500 RepID=A0ABM1AED0_APLCA